MTLNDYLLAQTPETLIEIFENAMDLMQQYNGRSYTYCVIMSIEGGKAEEMEDGTYWYTLPETVDVKID